MNTLYITVPRPESMCTRGRNRRGLGEICLFINENMADGIEIIEKHSSGFLWVKLCKKYFRLTSDLYICFCCIPPKESVYFKNVDVDLYDVLESGIRKYADFGKISVIGDLNARTGVLDDRLVSCEGLDRYIHCIDGSDISENNVYCNICRRHSLDTKTDSAGVRLIQICKDSELGIVNGRKGQDNGIGHFTFQDVQGRSVIDYALLASDFFDYVSDFVVYEMTSFSDHTPIELKITTNVKPDDAYGNIKVEKLLWDKSNVICFRDVLSDNLVDLDLLVDRIVNGNLSIDYGVSNFCAILYNKAFEVFGQSKIIHNGRCYTQRKKIAVRGLIMTV